MTKKDVLQKVAVNITKLPLYGGLIGAGLGAAGGAATGYLRIKRNDEDRKRKIFSDISKGLIFGGVAGAGTGNILKNRGKTKIKNLEDKEYTHVYDSQGRIFHDYRKKLDDANAIEKQRFSDIDKTSKPYFEKIRDKRDSIKSTLNYFDLQEEDFNKNSDDLWAISRKRGENISKIKNINFKKLIGLKK